MRIDSLYFKLSKVENEISTILEQIESTELLPYYQVFDKSEERKKDIIALQKKLLSLIKTKDAILDNLSREVYVSKIENSAAQRGLTLILNSHV